MSQINSLKHVQAGILLRFYLSQETKIALKSHFWHENAKCLPYIHDVVLDFIT